jgi:hypothetical protein
MPKEALAIEDSNIFNKLRSFLNSEEDEISQKDREILERWKFAYDQLQIEKKHMTAIRLTKMFSITLRTAYNDIHNAKKLFNPINRHDSEFERIWLINMIKDDILACKKISNIEKRTRLLERLYERFYKALGLDKDEIDRIDPELLGNNKLVAVFQINNNNIEFNLDDSNHIKIEMKEKLMASMYDEINIEDAQELLNKDGDQNIIDK